MRKLEFVQLLYNPTAGKRRKSRKFIEQLVYLLAQEREHVRVYPSKEKGDLTRFFDTFDPEGCKAIFILGGDGTINEVVNGMMNHSVDVPVFVCPIGTANDFAYYLGVKPKAKKCVELYKAGKLGGIDVGVANDQYFINICGAGLFMNSTMEFDPAKKAKWGKLAYYAKGVSMVKLLKHYRLRVVAEETEIEDDFFFFIAMNGVSTGGLKKIACDAVADDGLLDFVGVKYIKFRSVVPLFIKLLLGRHLHNKNVVYFRTKQLYVEAVNHDWVFGHADMDGQHGPDLPMNISVIPKALRFFIK